MKNADDDDKSDSKKFQSVARRFHDRKNFSKNEHIIQKDVFHVTFEIADFSEKESEAVNIMKTEQISSKIKKCKRSEIRLNAELKDCKKTSTKCSVCDKKSTVFQNADRSLRSLNQRK